MVREGLLVLSDSRISKDDVCAAIEHLCVEWRCNCHVFLLFWRQAVRRLWNLPYNCHVAILEALSECLPLFDVFCKRSLNFINRCLVSDNAVVSFVARHGVFHSRMFSRIGRNFQFCCRLRACDFVNRAHYKHVINKASTDRLDHSLQWCVDLIRELVMVHN